MGSEIWVLEDLKNQPHVTNAAKIFFIFLKKRNNEASHPSSPRLTSRDRCKFQKNKFLKYAKGSIFKFLSISQCQKLPQGICLGLGNHFFPNWKHKKSSFGNYYFFNFHSEKSHSVEKEAFR